jgi:two-component system, NarL family, nitrate/nitrite response regulator NarL
VIRVFLLAGARLYREALTIALERAGSIEIVGGAEFWPDTSAEIAERRPDVVLLDTAVPGAARAVADVLAVSPTPRLVAIARTDDEDELLACAEAGVSGYIANADSIDDAVHAIESVARGELLTTPRVAAVLLERVRILAATTPSAATSRLTPREREIAELLGDGHTNKAIAQQLGIEPTTVKNHVHNILEKLQVSRRTDAALRLRAGLVGLPRS